MPNPELYVDVLEEVHIVCSSLAQVQRAYIRGSVVVSAPRSVKSLTFRWNEAAPEEGAYDMLNTQNSSSYGHSNNNNHGGGSNGRSGDLAMTSSIRLGTATHSTDTLANAISSVRGQLLLSGIGKFRGRVRTSLRTGSVTVPVDADNNNRQEDISSARGLRVARPFFTYRVAMDWIVPCLCLCEMVARDRMRCSVVCDPMGTAAIRAALVNSVPILEDVIVRIPMPDDVTGIETREEFTKQPVKIRYPAVRGDDLVIDIGLVDQGVTLTIDIRLTRDGFVSGDEKTQRGPWMNRPVILSYRAAQYVPSGMRIKGCEVEHDPSASPADKRLSKWVRYTTTNGSVHSYVICRGEMRGQTGVVEVPRPLKDRVWDPFYVVKTLDRKALVDVLAVGIPGTNARRMSSAETSDNGVEYGDIGAERARPLLDKLPYGDGDLEVNAGMIIGALHRLESDRRHGSPPSSWNSTAVHSAARAGARCSLAALLSLGFPATGTAEGYGILTPLHLAAIADSWECASLLIAAGADPGTGGPERGLPEAYTADKSMKVSLMKARGVGCMSLVPLCLCAVSSSAVASDRGGGIVNAEINSEEIDDIFHESRTTPRSRRQGAGELRNGLVPGLHGSLGIHSSTGLLHERQSSSKDLLGKDKKRKDGSSLSKSTRLSAKDIALSLPGDDIGGSSRRGSARSNDDDDSGRGYGGRHHAPMQRIMTHEEDSDDDSDNSGRRSDSQSSSRSRSEPSSSRSRSGSFSSRSRS